MYKLSNFLISEIKNVNDKQNYKSYNISASYFQIQHRLFALNGDKKINKINNINFRFKKIDPTEKYIIVDNKIKYICQFTTYQNKIIISPYIFINIGKRIIDIAQIYYYDKRLEKNNLGKCWINDLCERYRIIKDEDGFTLPSDIFIGNKYKFLHWIKNNVYHNVDLKNNVLLPAYICYYDNNIDNKKYYIDGTFITDDQKVIEKISNIYKN